MSSELSRVETYNRSRKKNQTKKPPATSEEAPKAKPANSRREQKKPAAAPPLSRVRAMKERKSRGVLSSPADSRSEAPQVSDPKPDPKQTYPSRAHKHKAGYGAASTEEELDSAPARSETYGSRRNVISKYFTNSLFFLFLVLTVFLVYWGVKGAPPLEDLW